MTYVFKRLPQEIEPLILAFLIMPEDVRIIQNVSRSWRRGIDHDVPVLRDRRIIRNRVRMLMEDKTSYGMPELGAEWERLHRWEWPSLDRGTENFECTPLWKPGDYVDVLDRVRVWGSALILSMTFKSNTVGLSQRFYTVQFLGWSDTFNEEVTGDKIARFATKCMNSRCKYDSLVGGHLRWIMCAAAQKLVDSKCPDHRGEQKLEINHGGTYQRCCDAREH